MGRLKSKEKLETTFWDIKTFFRLPLINV